jgi:hypothetical protein
VLVVVTIAGASGCLLEVDAEGPAIEEKKGAVGSTGRDLVQAVPRGSGRAFDDLVGVAAQADGAGRQTAFVCAGPKTLAFSRIILVLTIPSILATARGGGSPASIAGRSSGFVATGRGVRSGSLMAIELLVKAVWDDWSQGNRKEA